MTVARRNWKHLAGKMLFGAVVGASATAALLAFWDGRGQPPHVLAIAAGMIYGLVGLVVGLGALVPSTGARLLNVEDADELREERPRIGPSAVAFILIGVFFLSLAAVTEDGAGGLIGRETAAIVAAVSLVSIVLITAWSSRRSDELVRQISRDASAAAMHVALFIIGGWAALAHLGYVEWVSPLSMIAGLALLELIVVIAICGQRGLLAPR